MTEFRLNEQDLKQLLAEHEQLTRRILHYETISIQVLTATLWFVFAVIGLASSSAVQDSGSKSILFFVAESAAIVAMMQSTDRGRLTFMVASYLRVFTEAELQHLKWETRLLEFRKLNPKRGYSGFIGNQLWLYTIIAIVNFAIGSYYAIESSINPPSKILYSPVIGILVLLLILTTGLILNAWYRYKEYVRKHVKTLESTWREVRDEEIRQQIARQQKSQASRSSQ